MKCFVSFNGRDHRFPADVNDFLASRGVQPISNPNFGLASEEQLAQLLADADASLAGTEPYTAKVIESAPKLKIIARVGVGFDAIDLAAATRAGVFVTTTPVHELAQGMAEHTFALVLSLVKQIPNANSSMRRGEWRGGDWVKRIDDLHGSTFGLLGTGRIGSETAKRAKAFDMRLVYYDVVRREDLEKSLGMEYVTFDRLLQESDILSIHAPLTPQTRGIMNKSAFEKMKPTAILVNTARGAIVDEGDLVKALEEGRIGGACLDTFASEPLASPSPLYRLQDRLPNVIVTPHLGYGVKTGRAMIYYAANQVLETLNGGVPQNVMNPDAIPRRKT